MTNTEEITKLRKEKERLEKELIEAEKQLNWLAGYAAENPCPMRPNDCPQKDSNGYNPDICIQCWREYAREETQ